MRRSRESLPTGLPDNPEFQPIVLSGADEGEVAVVAELVDLVEAGDLPDSGAGTRRQEIR